MYLARAIHAANPPKPKTSDVSPDPASTASAEPDGDADATVNAKNNDCTDAVADATDAVLTDTYGDALRAWKATRRAVIHTIDNSATHSSHAAKVIKNFRHGLYIGNVDVHVGDVSDWVKEQSSLRSQPAVVGDVATESATTSTPTTTDSPRSTAPSVPFLSHAFLDLPNTHAHIETVANVLRTDGTLITFSPSISQISDCVLHVSREGLPLTLDTVIELGVNGGTGGREWDLRPVKPRKSAVENEVLDSVEEDAGSAADGDAEAGVIENPALDEHEADRGAAGRTTANGSTASAPAKMDAQAWSMICRPKVGDRIVGGGFLGVFKKLRL